MPLYRIGFRRTVTTTEVSDVVIHADDQTTADAKGRRIASQRSTMDQLPWRNGIAVVASHEVTEIKEVQG